MQPYECDMNINRNVLTISARLTNFTVVPGQPNWTRSTLLANLSRWALYTYCSKTTR